jgi:hypothetical protein
MKANKALKRLTKIEALMSDVAERYSASAPHTRKVFQDAQAAVTRAKEAVRLQASSGAAKNPPVKHSKPPSKATPEVSKPKRRLSAAGREAISQAAKKRWAAKRVETEKPEPVLARKAAVKKAVAGKLRKKATKAPGTAKTAAAQ